MNGAPAAPTQQQSWRECALALCMAAHDRLGASCSESLRSVVSSRDLVLAIMWHVFPHGAPLVIKVQYICERLDIKADQPLIDVVARATDKLKLTSAFTGLPLTLKVDGCLDSLVDRTSHARPPSTPDLSELKAGILADMVAQSERAWRAMQEARRSAAALEHVAAAPPPAPAAGRHVVSSVGSAESLRKWLHEHCVSFPEGATLADLETIVEEERAAIAEEESALAQYSAAMATRGQPTVVSAVSTSGASRTVLDEARAGEELARRELMEAARAADVLATIPVAVGSVVSAVAAPETSPSTLTQTAGGGREPVVTGQVVDVVDDNERRPKGGVAALINTMRIN